MAYKALFLNLGLLVEEEPFRDSPGSLPSRGMGWSKQRTTDDEVRVFFPFFFFLPPLKGSNALERKESFLGRREQWERLPRRENPPIPILPTWAVTPLPLPPEKRAEGAETGLACLLKHLCQWPWAPPRSLGPPTEEHKGLASRIPYCACDPTAASGWVC